MQRVQTQLGLGPPEELRAGPQPIKDIHCTDRRNPVHKCHQKREKCSIIDTAPFLTMSYGVPVPPQAAFSCSGTEMHLAFCPLCPKAWCHTIHMDTHTLTIHIHIYTCISYILTHLYVHSTHAFDYPHTYRCSHTHLYTQNQLFAVAHCC
jgi:hypothetical protein